MASFIARSPVVLGFSRFEELPIPTRKPVWLVRGSRARPEIIRRGNAARASRRGQIVRRVRPFPGLNWSEFGGALVDLARTGVTVDPSATRTPVRARAPARQSPITTTVLLAPSSPIPPPLSWRPEAYSTARKCFRPPRPQIGPKLGSASITRTYRRAATTTGAPST
jgi:hypothetical protein